VGDHQHRGQGNRSASAPDAVSPEFVPEAADPLGDPMSGVRAERERAAAQIDRTVKVWRKADGALPISAPIRAPILRASNRAPQANRDASEVMSDYLSNPGSTPFRPTFIGAAVQTLAVLTLNEAGFLQALQANAGRAIFTHGTVSIPGPMRLGNTNVTRVAISVSPNLEISKISYDRA
jgi:hypothetical protein